MNNKFILIFGILFIILFTGCTNKINISPDPDNIFGKDNENEFNFNVAYILPIEKENIFVTTPGGGGYDVGYYPYKDIETSFRTVLNNLYKKVYKFNYFPSNTFLKDNNIKYVFNFEIETQSSSQNSLAWPPTNFNVNIRTFARDINNNLYWEDFTSASGYASFGEFKIDFGLAGKRAITNALNNLYFKIKGSQELQ